MAKTRRIEACFSEDKEFFRAPEGETHSFSSSTGPYEYLLGALAGCFYRTLSSFERKCSWNTILIDIAGEKREEIPATLKTTKLTIRVSGVTDKEEFRELVRKAEEECSIYNTVKMVSGISCEIIYE